MNVGNRSVVALPLNPFSWKPRTDDMSVAERQDAFLLFCGEFSHDLSRTEAPRSSMDSVLDAIWLVKCWVFPVIIYAVYLLPSSSSIGVTWELDRRMRIHSNVHSW